MLKLTGTSEVSNIIDVSKCDAYKDEHCKYHTAIMFTEHNLCSNFPNCYYRQLKKCEQKLDKIKELATPLCCNNPLDCWMNKDDGTGDIYGCEGDDYKGCPSGFASYILKIIEGVEDE